MHLVNVKKEKEIHSFQDNLRKTFILFSITPVIGIVFAVIVLSMLTWSASVSLTNQNDNHEMGEEISQALWNYYRMVYEVEGQLSVNEYGVDVPKDKIFRTLYNYTADYDDIGNLIIADSKRDILFAADSAVPDCITEPEYGNWGVWKRIKSEPGVTNTVVYEGDLYVVRGMDRRDDAELAIFYMVPSQVIAGIAKDRNRFCIVTDENGWIYFSNTQGLNDEFGQINAVFEGNNGIVRLNNHKYVCYETVLDQGLKMYTFSDINSTLMGILVLTGVIVVIFIAIITITFRSTATMSEVYTKDIKKIEDSFNAVQNGNLDVSLGIDSSKEFQNIGNDFNEMLNGLKMQIAQNKELAETVAFSQVKRLESQFNPHFLFNTLDNIRFMAKIDADAADKMIVSLSGLLRYSIRETREEVTVKEDLDNLQYYLNILQIRFNRRFAYSINVAEDIKECLIPKLLLQPILENSIKYGFGEKEKLTVTVKGYAMHGDLIFICEDDGVGLDEEKLDEIKKQLRDVENMPRHIGLYNIHQRIRLMYKGEYGLDISSKAGEGTVVRLVLPMRM